MKKLVTVGPDNYTGFRKHIEEIGLCYDGPNSFIPIKSKGSEEINLILSEKPDLTIIGARNWIKRNRQILRDIPGKKGLLYVGPLGQNEISEIEVENFCIFMDWLGEDIDYMLMGSKDLVDRLARSDVRYMPAPFVTDLQEYKLQTMPEKNIVSILNDKARHKNTLNTFGGLALSKEVQEVRTNGLTKEYRFIAEAFGLGHILRDVGKLTHEAYRQEIMFAKLTMHLSYSEGLCYSALESLYSGRPVLTTNAMPWFYHPLLQVSNPADHEEIGYKIDTILSLNEADYTSLCSDCRFIAEKKITENNGIVRNELERLLS